MKKIFTLFISLFIALSLSAYDFRSGDLFYNITSSSEPYTVEVACALSSITTATIPRTVTYNGTIYSVTSIGYPAFYMCESLTSVTIPNGVTNIGNSVFYGCSSLTSITIPNSVTSIGDDAFYDCDGLTSITIPNSVTSIGNYAFLNCDGLTSITIPNNITSIGQEVFSSCSSLTSVVWNAKSCADFSSYYDAPFYYIKSQITSFSFGDDVEYIPADLCSGMSKLISITIPNSVTSIGNYAFYGCSGLTSLTIPNSVTSIGQSAFYGCSGLTSVTLGNSVTSIGKDAFFDCDGLTSITIPNSVTSIGESAFSNCNSLTSLVWNAKSCDDFQNPFDTYDCKITSLTIGESVQDIPEYLCSYMGKLTSVVWNVKSYDDFLEYGDSPFSDYNPITSFTFGESVQHIPAYLCSGLDNLTSVTIGSNVTSIGNNAFYGCDALTSITIPNSVTSIGNQAFADCFSLTSITIPNSVTSIGESAFSDCDGLTSVTIGNSVTSIGEHAFSYCDGLTSIAIPNSVTSIGNSFSGCSGLISITLPNSVISIGDDAFYNCSSLSSITIPNSVTRIGNYAFYGCSGLTSITIPNSVTSIGGRAFSNCDSLTSVVWNVKNYSDLSFPSASPFDDITYQITSFTFGDDVEYIPAYLCYGMNLSSITIPDGVTSIGNDAFAYCSGLTSVTIGNSITSIGNYAFSMCSSLNSVTIGNSVTSIGDFAFGHCSSLTSITIPDGVTSIGNQAFAYCSGLTSVTIGNSITTIGNSLFLECDSLTSVVWNVKNCSDFSFHSDVPPFFGFQITSFIFGDDVEYIPANLCYGMSNLSSITIPNSVTSIGDAAFLGSSSFDTIYVEATTPPTLVNQVFPTPSVCHVPCGTLAAYKSSDWASQVWSFVEDCVEGKQITYTSTDGNIVTPHDTTGFGANIVSNTYENGIGTITFDGPVTSIGDYAFEYCSSLTSITIPDSVTSIGDYAFYGCSSFTSVTIPNSVTSIGKYAFSHCSSLTSIAVSNSVTSIGSHAFADCRSLTSITIPNSVTSIGNSALGGCASLTSIVVEDDNATYDSRNNCNAIIETATNTLVAGCKNTIIPNSVTSIGSHAFDNCSSLTSITIPYSVTSIGNNAFYNCDGLTSVTIPYSVTSIGGSAFADCSYLTSIIIPNGVKSIGGYAFAYCRSLTSITIPNSVTSIANVALGGCDSLTSIVVEEGNTIYDSRNNCNAIIETATNSLIAGCQNTIIPNSVTSIGSYAFHGCDGLTSITIPNSVTSIGKSAFDNCHSLTSVIIPNSVTSIGDYVFYYCYSLDTIHVKATTPPTLGDDLLKETPSPICVIPCGTLAAYEASDWAQYVSEFVEEGCIDPTWQITYTSNNDSIVTPYATDVFGANIVSNTYENGVGTIIFDGPVTSIGVMAFDGRSSLASITIPDSVTYISCYAFNSCSSLTSIVVESGNTTYDSRENCNAIIETATNTLIAGCQNTIIPNSVTRIGTMAFYGRSNLISLIIPNSVTKIDHWVFCYCSSLTSITIPNSVTSILFEVFSGCDALTSIVVDSGNTTYDSRENCNAIIETATNTLITGCQNTIIPNSVTSIGEGAFAHCEGLTSITIPNSVTSIGSSAFDGCSSLTSINIPNSVTSIGEGAFEYCSSLDTIHVEATTPPALEDSTVFRNTLSPVCVIPCGTLAAYEVSDWASQVGEFVEVCPSVVKAKVPASWENDDITVWVWTDGAGTEYPTTKEGDWYVYTHSDNTAFNIIFKSGTGWKGNTYQTVDINGITANTCLQIQSTNTKATYTIVDCPSIIYELNGGVTNDYDWMSKDDMYHELLVDINAIMPTTKVDVDTVTLAYDKTKNIQEGIPTYWGSLDSLLTNFDFLSKWSWLINYMDSTCVLESKSLPSTSSAYLRYNLSAFFFEKEYTRWPTTPDYSKYGLYPYYQPAWQHAYDNPTNPTEEFVLNAPYREGYTFAGWYTTPDFSGEKVTTINAETEGTLYAKWIDETWVIKYTSTDGNIITPYATDVFGANIVSNIYENGVGTITFDGPVTSIGRNAFRSNSRLKFITIPNSTTAIGNSAFNHCSNLAAITIPNSVTSIGKGAFNHCSNLAAITIPNSVTSIGNGAFNGCSGLTSILVEKGNTVYDSRNNCNAIIETATNTLIVGCKNTIITNSVTIIGDYVFHHCSGLTSITIPNSVTSIGVWAFSNCSSLNIIHVRASVPPILEDSTTFAATPSPTCYIPCGTLAAYEASDWAQYVSEFIEEGCISFELNGGVVSAELPIYIASSYTLPTPTREGYIFRGWYNNPQGIGNRLSTLPAGYEGTIYAYWTKEPTDALNPFAYALSSELSQDNSQLLINYSLNARAMDVQIVIMDGETAVKTIACDGLSKGSHSIAIPTAGLPEHKQLTWKVEVKGAEVTEPTEYAVNYSFYHPSAVDIDNNPENPTFGMILTNEGMHSIKNQDADIFKDYLSYNMGAGIYAFNPAFEPMPNGDKPGYNGGIEFTEKRADAPDSITNGYTAFSPRRIRISEDGRIFVTSLNTDGNYLWEVNPANMNEWTPIFQGALNDNKELVDAGGNFIAAPNTGFDVKSSGEDLQLMMYSVNLNGITGAAMGGFRCDEYNLGTATSWATAPSKNWVLGKYAIIYTGTQVVYDNEGGIWIASYRGTASDTNPGLVHINKDGVEDTKLVWSMLRNAGIRFNNDFSKLVVAGNNGTAKKATIYAVSKDANGVPVLTEETVIDMAILGNNINDFAFDYAGNLYACSNSNEKIVAWAMPRSADEVITTPAASKYNFIYSDDAITYELNGGVTNDYGWQSKGAVALELQNDYNAAYGTSKEWAKSENGYIYYKLGEEWVREDLVPAGTDCITAGFIAYVTYNNSDNFKNLFAANPDKYGWLNDIIIATRTAAGLSVDEASMAEIIYRYELSAFFLCSPERTSWPGTSSYEVAGTFESFKTIWKHAFDNPTNPAEEFVLNAPYKEGYTFAGWYTTPDFSGEKVTTINAETEGTLYAKWIDETWVIKYTSTDGNIVIPYQTNVLGANIVSNTYENGVGTITFDGPVTSIGYWAFYSCESLTSITIPNSVTSIGNNAFYNCYGLTLINIPNSVTSIGNYAFLGCDGLTSITIPNSVTSIGDRAFEGCSGLTSITIPNSVTTIGSGAFSYCSGLTSIVVDVENTTYDSRENCNAIIETATNTLITGCQNTIILNSVTSIGYWAFYRCESLTSITIPNSVTSIRDGAFYYCYGLTSVTIPNSVTSIGGGAFSGCSGLTSIVVDVENTTYDSRENCNAIIETATNTIITGCQNTIIPNSVMSIGNSAFDGCYDLTSITIPNSVTSIGNYAFYNCLGLTLINIPNSVTSIGFGAFNYCYGLTSVTIPNSVTSIGYRTFNGCSSLDTIHIEAITPPTLETEAVTSSPTCYIPCGTLAAYEASDWASQVGSFVEECVEGQQITYTSTNDSIVTPYDVNAFDANIVSNVYENGVGTITFDGVVKNIGYYAFHNCDSLISIIIPNSVKNIGYGAFSGCVSLESITIGSGVTTIGEDVFGGCGMLTSIEVDANNVTFDSREDCNAIIKTANNILVAGCKTTVIPSGIKGIGNNAFAGNWDLTSIEIPDGVETIGSSAFGGCTLLRSVTLPNTLTTIGNDAFSTCPALTSITIPSSVKKIDDDAFWCDYALDTIYVEATTPPTLGYKPFYNAPVSHCFIPCGTLAVYEASDWASQVGRFEEDCVEGQQIYYTSSNDSIVTPFATDVFGANIVSNTYENGVGTITFDGPVTSIGRYAFVNCSSLTSITVPNSVTSIGESAFYSCESLNSISLSNSLAYIGNSAFYSCSFASITLPESVTNIGEGAFYMCDSLVTINIPDGITSIENRTFYSCESLASIKIPDNVVSIGEQAFYFCESLTSVNIPNNVTNIGDGAFDHCSTIDSIFVPKSVTQIGEWAFRDMRSLISIVVEDGNTTYDSRENCNAIIETASNTLIFGCKKTIIPNTIVQIGSHAFESSASGISLLVIPNSVQYIGEYAFNCLNMWKITVEAIHPPVLADNVFAPNHSNYLKCIIPCGTLDAYQSSAWANQVGSFEEECVEGQQITYTSTDGNIVTPNKTDVFGANIVSNTYENGVGTITFDAPVIRIGDAAFSSCESLTSITIPNSVTGIGNSAFSSCTSLTSITIPNSVTSIGTGVFSNCYFLASVIIPNSVTSIEAGVFYRCSSLTYVTIPNSVTSIGERAFAYCSSLDTIHVEAITPPTLESNVFIESPVSICYIPCGTLAAYASSDWASQVSEFVEACVEGQQIYYTSTDGNIITPYRTDDFGANIVSNTYENGVGIITFDAPVKSVAFSSCSTLTSIIIPNSVTSIGSLAFQNCSSLTSINIPSSIMSITQYALAGCSSLTSIVVESGNTSYDSRNNCNAIIETSTNTLIAGCQNTIIPNNVTSIGTAAFRGCSAMVDITIPNSITTIGWGAFGYCSSLTSITIPNSVTSILNFAFHDCSSLDTIRIEATTPPTLGENVFALTPSPVCVIPCGTLAAYEASDWAQYVSEFVEEGCAPIQMCGDDLYWEYADGVLTITGTGGMYDYAADTDVPWYDVRGNIKTVSLPDAMTKIGQNAFYKCTAMTSINMPTSLTAIGEKAFAQDTKLACEIILPASMTAIASRAFFNCQAVTAFHLEATTPPTIPNDAFERTTAPIHVPCGYGHVYGKHAQWGELNLEMCELLQDNVYYYPIDGHTARAVTYYSNPTDTIVIPSAVVIDGMPRTVTEVADFAFMDCANLPAIYFSEGLEYIGERAFVRCYGLQGTIVLPATLETIGERAFSYCNNVDRYTIQAMTPPVLGANAFTGDNKNALFYISCEAMDDYTVATNWSSLKSRLRDACLNIYHYNTALGANGVHTTEDTLVASIYYRRKFTPYRWETLYLPFEVDRVTVLEDGVEYDLTAWDIVYGGHYFLAKPDGMLNKEILFGFTDELESHTPYIIQFSDAYYTDKLITFYGKESWNKLSTSFEVLSSSAWMQIAGNTTLQDQLLEKPVYMLRSGLDFILQKTTTTLHPFECYVMPYATPSGTPARMNVRFRGDVPTAVESVKGNESHLTYSVDGYTLTVYPQGQAFSIYSLNGALIYSCEAGKEAVDCELNSGCYLLHAGTEAHKIML